MGKTDTSCREADQVEEGETTCLDDRGVLDKLVNDYENAWLLVRMIWDTCRDPVRLRTKSFRRYIAHKNEQFPQFPMVLRITDPRIIAFVDETGVLTDRLNEAMSKFDDEGVERCLDALLEFQEQCTDLWTESFGGRSHSRIQPGYHRDIPPRVYNFYNRGVLEWMSCDYSNALMRVAIQGSRALSFTEYVVEYNLQFQRDSFVLHVTDPRVQALVLESGLLADKINEGVLGDNAEYVISDFQHRCNALMQEFE
ncbi:MAG: hypothetical protein ACD_65C00015G0003 [uncultured bacterium]|nr:MAG: hypothetical protein ACD_65C00015G0003 [uncultured bacterium]OGJ47567.1 MAG: hypothetical protein A2244_00690 [Candidatus Peregrinibacteria bacterium RIFOXYA2_FULL_41_18]OGJ49632.1 MAG: hypothetical protein A2344_02420 [Candidatus Peregrinibacteria bacterium RIFOXYB12_FULL_41_12]OGJ53152.1 MAG: hypothetical protein A2448_03195 [Candidatus Peregrinibacteria bacterium RIFOXYC2_FULL_41_22]OGJ55016.1 MAG: hypothetical protein A2336_02185 [Candidatus Peregrinibacteria bacterium RIFOXYB2_FULL